MESKKRKKKPIDLGGQQFLTKFFRADQDGQGSANVFVSGEGNSKTVQSSCIGNEESKNDGTSSTEISEKDQTSHASLTRSENGVENDQSIQPPCMGDDESKAEKITSTQIPSKGLVNQDAYQSCESGISKIKQKKLPVKSKVATTETLVKDCQGVAGTSHTSYKPVASGTLRKEDIQKLTTECFPNKDIKKIHNHLTCSEKCFTFPEHERKRISGKFLHTWLSSPKAYSEKTGVWWAVYIEGEGVYCLLCRKHDACNVQNKKKTFNLEPSTRFRKQTIGDHLNSTQHLNAERDELEQQRSPFQQELVQKDAIQMNVYRSAFKTAYWIMAEEIANRKLPSLLRHLENCGNEDLQHFQYSSAGTYQDMFNTLGSILQEEVISPAKEAHCFGLLVDEVTDIAVIEQQICFIQYFDRKSSQVRVEFLFIADCLEDSTSANAQTLTTTLVTNVTNLGLDIKRLTSLVTDGASVMLGVKSGVAARLRQTVNPALINVHCVCHRLALACTDAAADVTYIHDVQNWLTMLWKFFKNSPKRMSVLVDVQKSKKQLKLSDEGKQAVSRKLKKACQTRWLSFNNSVQSAVKEYPALIQTLQRLKDHDATADGLLRKIYCVKFVGILYILKDILPILAALSKVFQKGSIDYSQIYPSLEYYKTKLHEVAEEESSITALQKDVQPGEKLEDSNFSPTDHQIQQLENFKTKYVAALCRTIDSRFDESLPVLGAFAVFDPSKLPAKDHCSFKSYGEKNIERIANHFSANKKEKDKEVFVNEIKAEWGKLKYDMHQQRESETRITGETVGTCIQTETEQFLVRLAKMQHFYPILGFIAEVVLSMPVSNAWPERGASGVKRVKSRQRASLNNSMLQTLLYATINGPDPSSKKADELTTRAAKEWVSAKRRRKLVRKNRDEVQKEKTICLAEASTQTYLSDDSTSYLREIVAEEIAAFVKAYELDDLSDDDDFCDMHKPSK